MTFNMSSIQEMIASGESETVEFKSGFNTEVIVTLNAFANTHGGTVFIGINDAGDLKGVDIGAETLKTWLNEVKQKTNPALIPDVYELNIENHHIIALYIQEYPIKPVALQGRYYKRVKNSNHQLNVDEISTLHLQTFNSSWDYYTDSFHTFSDMSTTKVQNVMDRLKARGLSIDDDIDLFLKKKGTDQARSSHPCLFFVVHSQRYRDDNH